MSELDEEQVKKDLIRWTTKLREVYLEMKEVYESIPNESMDR